MTEELLKHVFEEFNVLYKTIKLIFKSSAVLYRKKKQTLSLVSMFQLNLT